MLACAQEQHRDQQILQWQTQGLVDGNGVKDSVKKQTETHSQQEINTLGRKVLLEIAAYQVAYNLDKKPN